jgi:TctA family transporter
MFEENLRRALAVSRGDLMIFIETGSQELPG